MADIREQFSALFYDTETVIKSTPKAVPPTLTQVMAAVLSTKGINDPALAGSLAEAAEQMFALRTPATPAKK